MKPSMFIKIDGIDGESEDDDHGGWIDILSWSYGMSQAATTHIGGGGSAAQASVQDVSFVKWVDKSTPALMHTSLTGKHVSKAELQCTKASGSDKGGSLAYIVMIMEDIVISSVSTGGSSGEAQMTESVTLNFAKVSYKYTVQTADGGSDATPTVEWDVKLGEGSIS